MKPDETTVALMAATILGPLTVLNEGRVAADYPELVAESVSAARAILAEVQRTQPTGAATSPGEETPR